MSFEGITIVSDGTSFGTKVQVGDKFINGITKIEFSPLEVGGTVKAKISFDVVAFRMALKKADIECNDSSLAEHIKKALVGLDC